MYILSIKISITKSYEKPYLIFKAFYQKNLINTNFLKIT